MSKRIYKTILKFICEKKKADLRDFMPQNGPISDFSFYSITFLMYQ